MPSRKRARVGESDAGEQAEPADDEARCLRAMRLYRKRGASLSARLRRHASRWPPAVHELLAADEIPGRCAALDRAVSVNARFWDAVLSVVAGDEDGSGEGDRAEAAAEAEVADASGAAAADHADSGMLQAVMYSLVREWTEESLVERELCFGRVADALEKHKPARGGEHPRVLVPGAALMRLPLELVQRGYDVEANELSVEMLMVATYLLGSDLEAASVEVRPFIEEKMGHLRTADQFRPLFAPDVAPLGLMGAGGEDRFCIQSGDFAALYGSEECEGTFDAVATCYFLDTASVVVDYVRIIHGLLRAGGVWVNFGPLHFHWADADEDEDAGDPNFGRSMELSWESLKACILKAGFTLTAPESIVESAYTANPASTQQSSFRCVHFVAVKA